MSQDLLDFLKTTVSDMSNKEPANPPIKKEEDKQPAKQNTSLLLTILGKLPADMQLGEALKLSDILMNQAKLVDNNLLIDLHYSDLSELQAQNIHKLSETLSVVYDKSSDKWVATIVYKLGEEEVQSEDTVVKLSEDHSQTSVVDSPVAVELYDSLPKSRHKYLKVPVAKLGKWVHPVYGEINHTPEYLDQLERNYRNNILGYLPTLYLGHSKEGSEKLSEGYLVKMERDADTLYGIWEVNKDTYRMVEDLKVVKSSAELIPNYIDKSTGEPVGAVLTAMALTGRPFVPNLPNVVALEDPQGTGSNWIETGEYSVKHNSKHYLSESNTPISEQISNNVDSICTTEVDIMSEENKSAAEESTAMEKLSEKILAYEKQLSGLESLYTKQLEEVIAQNKKLSDKIEAYEQEKKERELAVKLSELNNLNIPDEIKSEYGELLKLGLLGAAEEKVLNSVRKLSEVLNSQTLVQYGTTDSTMNLNDPEYIDPYKAIVERNYSMAKSREV